MRLILVGAGFGFLAFLVAAVLRVAFAWLGTIDGTLAAMFVMVLCGGLMGASLALMKWAVKQR